MKNIIYMQSGGPTSVINATACGVIETASLYAATDIDKVYVGRHGIIGALNEDLIDTSQETDEDIAALAHTPGSAFGSCRFKLSSIDDDELQYQRLVEVFKAHGVGYFFYNGGGDSQDTAYKVSQIGQQMNYPLVCIGLPKTVDNDLYHTDNCPGFASAAKYIAISVKEAALDLQAMAVSSTKVFILEVMGRHTGWMAAAAALAAEQDGDAPHIILMPEVPFNKQLFLQQVQQTVEQQGCCVVVASEGVRDPSGSFLSGSKLVDAFGHHQLGGVAPYLANMIKAELGYKYHYAIADYLQRSARHISSRVDLDQAYAIGQEAVRAALSGKNNIMLTIERTSQQPYQWQIGDVPLQKVANHEKKVPAEFIGDNGFSITAAGLDYLRPLIQGEAYPPYQSGMPKYVRLKNAPLAKKLPAFELAKV